MRTTRVGTFSRLSVGTEIVLKTISKHGEYEEKSTDVVLVSAAG